VVSAVAFQKLDVRLMQLLTQKSLLFHSKDISITHQQLADELGITREAVSRVLKQMENEKLISLSRKKISLM
jgi:CRP/FNR family transcriptional regulator